MMVPCPVRSWSMLLDDGSPRASCWLAIVFHVCFLSFVRIPGFPTVIERSEKGMFMDVKA